MDKKFLMLVMMGALVMLAFGFMKDRHDRQARNTPARIFRGGMGS